MKSDDETGPRAVPWWLWIAWAVSLALFFGGYGDLERSGAWLSMLFAIVTTITVVRYWLRAERWFF